MTKQNLPPELTAQLERMIRRVRMIFLTRGLLASAAVTIGAILTIMGVDAAVVLYHPAARWAFSLSGLTLVLATVWVMLVRPLSKPLTLTRMARVLETRHPALQERISSAIELAEMGGADADRASAELIRLLTQDATTDLSGVQAKQEFTVRTVKPFLVAAAGVFVVLTLLFVLWPKESVLLFQRAVAPQGEFDTLQASMLEVRPGDVMLLEQSPIRIIVKTPERHGLRAEVLFERPKKEQTVERMRRLSPEGVEPVVYELAIPTVESSFMYRVRYGSGYTRAYSVTVVTAPRLVDSRVTCRFPAYTGLQTTQFVGEAQAVTALAGSRLSFSVVFDRPCASALRLNDLALPAAPATGAVWSVTAETNRMGRWSVTARDANGFTNLPVSASYTVQPDRPPEVAMTTPDSARLTLPPFDHLTCVGEASDDFGLGQVFLVAASDRMPEKTFSLKVTPTDATHVKLEGEPDLQALYDQNIRSFRLFLRVEDNLPSDFGGPQVRESRAVLVTLEAQAQTLREQLREQARKNLEELLRQAAQQAQTAADRVAETKDELGKVELPERVERKLAQSREATVGSEALLVRAAQATEGTPFASLAKDILDVRDQYVDPAFKKVEGVPLAAMGVRRQAGEEAERALRVAADKINELIAKNLQEENRKQQAKSQVDEVAKREAALAEQAADEQMSKQEMQEWANRQNETEQRLAQSKDQLSDEAFKQAMEKVQQARDAMQQAANALTPEQDQAAQMTNAVAEKTEQAATLAESAAQKALDAAEKAETVADNGKTAKALEDAAQKTRDAANQALAAAKQAEAAAKARQTDEQKADVADRQAVAERAAQAAADAQKAAEQAAQSAEQARQAADAAQQGKPDAQKDAQRQAETQAAQAATNAVQARAEATEAARQADEQTGLEKAEEAGQLAAEAAALTQRAAELAAEAAAKTQQAEGQSAADQAAAAKEAAGLSEQAKQVASEAQKKADSAAKKAKDQLDQLAQEAQQAAAQAAAQKPASEQAAAAVEQAQAAATQAVNAVESAEQAQKMAQDLGPFEQSVAERMKTAADMAQQAADLAKQSGERTQDAEKNDLGGKPQEQAATQQALEEARMAAKLAEAAAAMAQELADQAAQNMADLAQDAKELAQQAAAEAQQVAQLEDQAAQIAHQQAMSPELEQAAAQNRESAKLTSEAADLAQQALQGTPQASQQAQGAQEKAKQALALARQAKQQAGQQATPPSAQQQQAAQAAQQASQTLTAAMQTEQQASSEAWVQVQKRLAALAQNGGGGGEAAPDRRRLPDMDWLKFRGEAKSEAYEEMLKKTPAEYRELVKQYFEALSNDRDK